MATSDTLSTQYEYLTLSRESNSYDQAAPVDLAGRMRVAWFQHTCPATATGDAGSTIKLTKLPAGARVLDFRIAFNGAGAAGTTLAIGDSADPDRLVSAFDIGTAGKTVAAVLADDIGLRSPTTEEPDIGFGYKYTAETDIIATSASAAMNGDLIWGYITYVVD